MSTTGVVHFSFPFLVHYCIPIDNKGRAPFGRDFPVLAEVRLKFVFLKPDAQSYAKRIRQS